MKKYILSILCLLVTGGIHAQGIEHGLVGFAATPKYGVEGTIGGGLGEVVRVADEEGLRKYCSAPEPYTILFEGTLSLTNEQDIDVASDKTIIGLNGRAVLKGIGFRGNGVHNVVIRGFTIRNAHQDAIAFRQSHHVWIDHCDLGSSDDGLLDFTIGSDLLTASWNRLHHHNKVSVCNSGTQHPEDVDRINVSYHHNAFVENTQRNPRVGYGCGHIWNNYYEEITSYCIGFFCGARVIAEQNSFLRCQNPFNQMYSKDYASPFYGFVSSVDNRFIECSGCMEGIDYAFDAESLYDYRMTLHQADEVADVVKSQAGPIAGLEYDLIPLPNHGRIHYPHHSPTLKWSKAPGAKAYHVYLSPSLEGLDAARLGKTASNAIKAEGLKASTTYYWRVDVQLEDTLLQGAVWQFTTAPQLATTPYPADGETHVSLQMRKDTESTQPLVLSWKPAFGADKYRLALADEGNKVVRTAEVDASVVEWQPASLPYGHTYTWTVTPIVNGKAVSGVPQWTFTTPIAEAREGMNEAEVWTRGLRSFVEVQDGTWFKASGDKVVSGEAGVGTLYAEWRRGHVMATISVVMFDESDGNGRYRLFINEELVATIVADSNNDALVNHPFGTFELSPGDQLRIELLPEGGESCRTDCIEIVQDSALIPHRPHPQSHAILLKK